MTTVLLPNLIVAGVVKGGTTSIFRYLSWHPEICSSKIKETNYFLPLRYGEEMAPLNEYSKYFSGCSGSRYVMEASPGYMYGGKHLARSIYQHLGPTKILLILRDPKERLLSYFKHLRKGMKISKDMPFDEYIILSRQVFKVEHDWETERDGDEFFHRGIGGGFYAKYVADWYDVFGDSVKVLFFEHLKEAPFDFMFELCNWLEIDHSIYYSRKFTGENRGFMYKNKAFHKIAHYTNKKFEVIFRRHYWLKEIFKKLYFMLNEANNISDSISEETLLYLESLYAESNNKLYQILMSKGYSNFPSWINLRSV